MRYAVSHIDWFDHELVTKIVEADDWHSALLMHPMVKPDYGYPRSSIEDAKAHAWNLDSMIEVVQIP